MKTKKNTDIITRGRAAEQWFFDEAARAARAAHMRLMKSFGNETLYLYFKRGSLTFASELPEGYELGCSERCPINLTTDQLIRWTIERSKRLACLPVE